MHIFTKLLAAALLIVALHSAAAAATLFPENTEVGQNRYIKMGEHRNIYKFFFKLYDAALFTEPGATPEDVLKRDCAFYLEFRYLRDIPKSAILESANHILAKNLSPEARDRIETSIDQLHATYRSVRAGDYSSLTYSPQVGTTFAINGKPLVTIPGKEFAELYLKIWLGEQPISVELRDKLLAR